jgi:predicted  nucleic acid-binding Zn-ribbon protein
MDAAQILLDLQEADFSILKIKKQLEVLPQRERILELRTKYSELQGKQQQVAQMRGECERNIKALQDESATLKQKIDQVQQQINASTDYKEVTSLSREIESLIKKAEKIEFETLKYMERADKIADVAAQVSSALEKLEKQDHELLADYQAQVALLQKQIAVEQQQRTILVGELPSELLTRYDKAVAAKNGVGAAYLEAQHCSGCRVEFTEGQLAKIKQGPQISECPYCHRLLVVKKQDTADQALPS